MEFKEWLEMMSILVGSVLGAFGMLVIIMKLAGYI